MSLSIVRSAPYRFYCTTSLKKKKFGGLACNTAAFLPEVEVVYHFFLRISPIMLISFCLFLIGL